LQEPIHIVIARSKATRRSSIRLERLDGFASLAVTNGD
jgi:hypothetical protein